MKKFIKATLSIAIVCCLLFSFAVTAFAAETNESVSQYHYQFKLQAKAFSSMLIKFDYDSTQLTLDTERSNIGVLQDVGGVVENLEAKNMMLISASSARDNYKQFVDGAILLDAYFIGKEGADMPEFTMTSLCDIDHIDYGHIGYSYEVLVNDSVYQSGKVPADPAEYVELIDASLGKNGVRITWKEVEGAAKYRVLYKTDGDYSRLTSTINTSVTHKTESLIPGTSYTYTVEALDGNGNVILAYDPDGITCTVPEKKPVVELNSTKLTDKGIRVDWIAVDNAAKYVVYVKTDGEYARLTSTANTAITQKLESLVPGTTYTYTVEAYDANGEIIAECDENGISCTYPIPTPYVTLKSAKVVSSGIRVDFEAVEGAAKYTVYVKTDDTAYTKLTSTSNLAVTHKLASLVKGTTYTYTVEARDVDNKIIAKYNPDGISCTFE